MRLSPILLISLSLLLAGDASTAYSIGNPPRIDSSAPIVIDWEDPEPPQAQQCAEDVLNEPWNKDKHTTLSQGVTTKLTMHITTLVDRTTGIEGFHTALDQTETSIEDRLDRLGATETEMEITIRLSGAILFDFDAAGIRPDAGRVLNEVVEVLGSYVGRPVKVEGHTDSVGSDEYNQKLTEQRAESVCDWFVVHGVEAGRLSSAGYGETKPVDDNSIAEGRQQNRRVEITIAK